MIYNEFGVYVDAVSGRRSRPEEFLWPTIPRWSSYVDPYLFLFMEKSIEIYDVHSSVWLQSMSIGKTRPLTSDGLISLSFDPNVTHQASTGQFLYLTQSSRETLALDISSAHSLQVPISLPTQFERRGGMNRDEGLVYMSSLSDPGETPDEQSSMQQ